MRKSGGQFKLKGDARDRTSFLHEKKEQCYQLPDQYYFEIITPHPPTSSTRKRNETTTVLSVSLNTHPLLSCLSWDLIYLTVDL